MIIAVDSHNPSRIPIWMETTRLTHSWLVFQLRHYQIHLGSIPTKIRWPHGHHGYKPMGSRSGSVEVCWADFPTELIMELDDGKILTGKPDQFDGKNYHGFPV